LVVLILSVLQGPDKGKRFEVPDHEPQLIGRSSEALPLTDTTVSRRHAELTPDDGIWLIRDLASQNGTWVNGVRIAERTRLRPGDQIRTGATLFVFGQTESRDPSVIRLAGPGEIDSTIERTSGPRPLDADFLKTRPPSNDDSVVMAEPEPRAAAVDHLRVIYRLTTLTSQITDRPALLRAVMDLVFAEFKPERGFILLDGPSDDQQPRPAVVKYRNAPENVEDAKIKVSKTIVQHVMKRGEGILSSSAMHDPRFASGDSVQQMNIRSAICSPITSRGKTLGAIYIDSTLANYTFTAEQLDLMNAIGQHTGLALANADLYAQKLQTERLAAIGETVASLSHSIKNILQGLRGGGDVVELGLKKDDLKVAKGGWGILKRNLDRIMGLTLNMLAFSRQRKPEFELTHLANLVAECVQLVEGEARTRGVAVITDLDVEMPPIPLDPSLMHQALMNLLANAVEAVPPQTGAVTIRTRYVPRSLDRPHIGPIAEIAVIDNGPGIPKAKQAWVFEPFNTTKGLKGTGLGLAVAKRITEEHNGRVEIHSVEGKGATFRVLLPADATRTIDPSETAGEKDSPPVI